MSKKLFIALLAAFALVAAGCDKTEVPAQNTPENNSDNNSGNGSGNGSDNGSGNGSDNGSGNGQDEQIGQSDLVGSWGYSDGTVAYVFKADGTYTEAGWEETIPGKWAMNGSKLSFTPDQGEAWEAEFQLIGGKAWLVLIFEEGEGAEKMRSFENYRKIGATVDSGHLTDGRWDACHSGVKPASYEKDNDYNFCMLVKGNAMDLYVPVWGMHIQGTFTFADGKVHIEADEDHIWQAAYKIGDSVSGSIGWSAWGCPDEAYESTWDDSYGGMNAETFELQSPYVWYTVTELKAMGEKPNPGDPTYEKNKYMFKYMLYEYGEGIGETAKDLCDFELCVAPNGKEAYGGAVGLNRWIYKR